MHQRSFSHISPILNGDTAKVLFNTEMKPPFHLIRCFPSRQYLNQSPQPLSLTRFSMGLRIDLTSKEQSITLLGIASPLLLQVFYVSLCANILPLKNFFDLLNDIVPIPALSLLLLQGESKLTLSEDSVSSSLYFASWENSSNRKYMLCRSWQPSQLLRLCQWPASTNFF